MTTNNLTNINFMNKAQFDALSEVKNNELYAIQKNIADLDSTQTITGLKTIERESGGKLYLKSTVIDVENPPAIQHNNQLWFQDKNNNSYAVVQANQNSDGSVGLSMTVKSKMDNPFASMSIYQDRSGNSQCSCPRLNTPSIEISHNTPFIDFHFNNSMVDYTSRIIESSEGNLHYVAKGSVDRGILETTKAKSLGANGYIKLGSGLIIQWGTGTANTVTTFPTPFTSADSYKIGIGWLTSQKYSGDTFITDKTSTGFIYKSNNYEWLAIGY